MLLWDNKHLTHFSTILQPVCRLSFLPTKNRCFSILPPPPPPPSEILPGNPSTDSTSLKSPKVNGTVSTSLNQSNKTHTDSTGLQELEEKASASPFPIPIVAGGGGAFLLLIIVVVVAVFARRRKIAQNKASFQTKGKAFLKDCNFHEVKSNAKQFVRR